MADYPIWPKYQTSTNAGMKRAGAGRKLVAQVIVSTTLPCGAPHHVRKRQKVENESQIKGAFPALIKAAEAELKIQARNHVTAHGCDKK